MASPGVVVREGQGGNLIREMKKTNHTHESKQN
jgi:hypothetical protein